VGLRGDSVLVREDCGGDGIRRIWSRRTGVDGWDDGEVVLVFKEVLVGDGVGLVERVLERRVERAKRELVDYVGKIEGWRSITSQYLLARREVGGIVCSTDGGLQKHTTMIQMLPKLLISMPSSRNVKIPLHFVAL